MFVIKYRKSITVSTGDLSGGQKKIIEENTYLEVVKIGSAIKCLKIFIL